MGFPASLATAQGITLELISLEHKGASVLLGCELRDDEAYRGLATEHREAMQAWERDARQKLRAWELGSDPSKPRPRLEPPPAQPADLFADVGLRVSDGADTHYRFTRSALGGTGTERVLRWEFEAIASTSTPPLTVTVDGSARWTETV